MTMTPRHEAAGERDRIGRDGDFAAGEHSGRLARLRSEQAPVSSGAPAVPCYMRRVLVPSKAGRSRAIAALGLPLFALSSLSSLALGCGSEAAVLSIEVTTGHETDAMTADPAVARVVVTGSTPEGAVISAEAAPGGDLDFGEVDGDLAYTFETTGYDGQGNAVMRGRSLGGIVLSSISTGVFPLFVERLGGWSRPPGGLPRTHTNAPAAPIGERYLFLTGGDAPKDAVESEEYDLFWWDGAKGATFPFAARTLVSNVTSLLAFGSDAVWLDSSGFASPTLPTGLTSFTELSGGSAVAAPDGRVFVVGGTRADEPTDAVLEIASDQTATVRRLVFPRAGAAAAWLPDVGLVVIGGDAANEGVELLPVDGTQFAVRDFPADGTIGAAATASTLGTVLLSGGRLGDAAAKTRLLDPRCTSDCTAKDLDLATPDAVLGRASMFSLGKGQAILVGDEVDPTGQTRTFVIDYLDPAVTEMPLREPRRGATAVPAPNGTLAVVGGVHPDGSAALTVEMYFPE